MTANVIWEITKKNIPLSSTNSWPWKLTVLDVTTSATLASAALALLLARSQLSRTSRPVISYTSILHKSRFIRKPYRVIHVRNAGAGHAVVLMLKYRYRIADPRSGTAKGPLTDWMDWHDVLDKLEGHNMRDRVDFALPNIANGAGLPLGSATNADLELVAFTEKATVMLVEFDILLRIEDTLGDQHERVLICMSQRHRKELLDKLDKKRLRFWR
ncbi:hypothetical protein ACFFV7_02430 [Nonomuraea spiralis]|uniref:Uncharacterized protein n=1 Tax=Nonomuraea spiralis TaxID=46182 RepID=A0ABV5I683_9ACTN|nr:hypothetical protein [Nonomuraea spiralis]